MEQQPTEHTDSTSQDSKPKSEPDPNTGDNHLHDANGDENKGSVATESVAETEAPGDADQLQAPSCTSPRKKTVRWRSALVTEPRFLPDSNGSDKDLFDGSNPYVSSSPAHPSLSFSLKDTMGSVRDTLGVLGKKMGEATKMVEDLAENTWQHLKTAPSVADAALGRIAQGTKILAEGGYEKVFRQTFETVPEEQLQNSYACYLSTSAGPVMGILYVSTAKLAFCSDNPLQHQFDGQTEWSYCKVAIPLHQLKSVNPSSSKTNTAEKYIEIISVDTHEFWFMGFLNYDGAVKFLQDALQSHNLQSA
ncbi:GLABRA2 expression modulator [Manihot esculenta]|uniref:GRAM domain-containing protein n=1 Tax=Manihot esculenta TaxID=3983 RepID=A0A2C9UXJ9_MANES|nr:GLABRA2 expression modulator [Manihot esculenta]OAY35764.1 hypothetical protein MANES_12G128400v8 [Manihot esculenta]